jgi:hypothetical protein
MVCRANSIPSLFTDGDTLDEYYKFRNQEKHILFVVFTATQLPHCETILSTKLFNFFCIMTMGISDFTYSKGESKPTDTFFLTKRSTDQHNGGSAKPVMMLCVT